MVAGKTFFLFFIRNIRMLLDTRVFDCLMWAGVFLVRLHITPLLLLLSFYKMVVGSKAVVYFDVYFFHFCGFLVDVAKSPFWSVLGDYAQKLYYRGFRKTFNLFTAPSRRLARFEDAWYWKGNPAMWLPDKMWGDIVESFDRTFVSRYRQGLPKIQRVLERFADSPYKTLWSGLLSLRAFLFKRRFRFPRVWGALREVFFSMLYRIRAAYKGRLMFIYHGLGREAIKYGDVPSLKASSYTFNFQTSRITLKDGGLVHEELSSVLLQGNAEVLEKEISSFFKPTISKDSFDTPKEIHNAFLKKKFRTWEKI